jgi:hypothetical protein
MTQLREEGWIHHLARHAVACFLTRGDLWISWEDGTSSSLVMLMIYRYLNDFFFIFQFIYQLAWVLNGMLKHQA